MSVFVLSFCQFTTSSQGNEELCLYQMGLLEYQKAQINLQMKLYGTPGIKPDKHRDLLLN